MSEEERVKGCGGDRARNGPTALTSVCRGETLPSLPAVPDTQILAACPASHPSSVFRGIHILGGSLLLSNIVHTYVRTDAADGRGRTDAEGNGAARARGQEKRRNAALVVRCRGRSRTRSDGRTRTDSESQALQPEPKYVQSCFGATKSLAGHGQWKVRG